MTTNDSKPPMIDEAEARSIVDRQLAKLRLETKIPLAVLEKETQEHGFGWVFFYNSAEYLETGNRRARLFGNSPLIVDRETGTIHQCGTSEPVEYYVKNYIASGDPFGGNSSN